MILRAVLEPRLGVEGFGFPHTGEDLVAGPAFQIPVVEVLLASADAQRAIAAATTA